MKRPLLVLLAAFAALPMFAAKAPVMKHEFLSETYTIDKKYRSMEGPGSTTSFTLGDGGTPELLWIVGVKTVMVGADGVTPQLPEFMCHVNVDLDAARHAALFNVHRPVATRLITLSQGMTDTHVPDGFGFPISSNEPLVVYTQVLNHNIENPGNMKVRHRVTFEYVRDRDLTEPIKPLLNLGASGTVILPEGPLSVTGATTAPAAADTSNAHGPSCLIAARAPNAAGMGGDYVDPQGRKVTGHWVVPPGRQTNHSDVTWFIGLPFDTKMHYAAVHLHPFAESLELRDTTADKTIFLAKARNPKGKVGLDHVDTFLSREGVQLHRDHKYELISVYNNPTGETHDSMASMFFGVLDREFRKPSADDLAARTADLEDHSDGNSVFLHTTLGTIPARLLRELAPKSARQFARLVRAGLLDGAKATRLERDGEATVITFAAPMTKQRRRMISELPLEAAAIPHDGTTFSICPRDGEPEVSFQLVVGRAASRDRRCTVFATVGAQTMAVRQIVGVPRDENGVPLMPIEITGGEVTDVTAVAQSSM